MCTLMYSRCKKNTYYLMVTPHFFDIKLKGLKVFKTIKTQHEYKDYISKNCTFYNTFCFIFLYVIKIAVKV